MGHWYEFLGSSPLKKEPQLNGGAGGLVVVYKNVPSYSWDEFKTFTVLQERQL